MSDPTPCSTDPSFAHTLRRLKELAVQEEAHIREHIRQNERSRKMKYVLAPDNIFQRFILPGEVVQFGDRCKTTAERLTAGEAAEYGVSKLKLATPLAFDALTQSISEVDPALIDGEWAQQWAVLPLSEGEQAAAHKASIMYQIAALESQITNRRIREAIRGQGKVWLDGIDDQITALRAHL